MSYNTKEEVASLSDKSPDLEAYITKHELSNPANLGAVLAPPAPNPSLDQGEVVAIPLRDGKTLRIRVFRPTKASEAPKPLIVLIHGGGFMYGDNSFYSPIARTIANLYSAVAVNISYRLAPMHTFPTAAHDTHDTVKWLSQNASSLGADLTKGFILFGGSAGANLAAVATQNWVSSKSSPPITGVSLTVPVILSEEIVPKAYEHLWFSMEQNQDALVLNKEAHAYYMDAYEPDVRSRDFSPFNDPTPHRGMPPVHFMVAGADPLRDDGLLYERVLREHGVKTKMKVYPGMPHGFNIFPGFQMAKRAFYDEMLGVGWLLGDEKTEEDVEKLVPGGDFHSV
ncbi:alpha/beta-hydrolase [Melanomma pulvis-pyrius CBS 109.77]|uniref:Alpha/beta-hydrolase n=1 Tax=Melanomma pulvis-pyrius CBS 109.77 TaxID=1314802 RepID=A0A6A6XT01_9PLEO|nr:alpha/beta-hydrolase [Melanomma pulvis-pyrius CBS 109.77]